MYVKRNDLEKIIEQETKRRVGTAEQQFGQWEIKQMYKKVFIQ
jgi:hypothetical protein